MGWTPGAALRVQCPVSCCRAFVCLFLRFALSGFCPQRFGASAPPGLPFVLQFWWSCPFCCVSLPLGGCVWHWSFVTGHCCWRLSFDAQGLLHAGVFFFLLVVVLGGYAWWLCLVVVFWRSGASARLGCSSSSLGPLGGCVGVCLVAFVFWRSGASAFSSSWWPRLPFVQWPSVASAYGWCCVLRFGSSSSFLGFFFFFFFFSSFFLFFLFLAFFFVCLCSLVFFLLPLPGVWPSLVLGLVGPT